MATPKELIVGSLSTGPQDKISLSSLLRMKSLNGGIREIHAALNDNDRNPQTLVDMVRDAFGIEFKPDQVDVSTYVPDKMDQFFAEKFGFKILPVAYIALEGRDVEAWIAPALIPANHPLQDKTEKDNSIHVVSRKNSDKNAGGFFYYVRLRVKDYPGVLGEITEEFGNVDISIREMHQPQAEISNEVDMAFLLSSCQDQVLQRAISAIAGLAVVLRVNEPLRAFNKSK